MEPLPTFRFHPDPLRTGSVVASENACVSCGHSRGFVYVGPVLRTLEDYNLRICPWCIADGSAHKRLGVVFQDDHFIGGGFWDAVPPESVEEIAHRTPGFTGWQQEHWWSHCMEAACFLGRAGRKELEEAGPQAIEAICDSTGLLSSDDRWKEFFAALDKDGSPTAYLFRCLHCGAFGGYQDCD